MPNQLSAVCPHCQTSLSYADPAKKIALKCPRCEQIFEVDAAPSDESPVTSVSPLGNMPVVAKVVASRTITQPDSTSDDDEILDGIALDDGTEDDVMDGVLWEVEGDNLVEEESDELVFTEQDLVEPPQPVSLKPKLPSSGKASGKRSKARRKRVDSSGGTRAGSGSADARPQIAEQSPHRQTPHRQTRPSSGASSSKAASSKPVWKRPAFIAVAASGLLCLGFAGWLVSTLAGGGDSDAVACAEELETLVEDSLEVLQVAEDTTKRGVTNEALGDLQSRLAALMRRVVDCPLSEKAEDIQPVRDALTAGAETRSKFVTLTRKLGDNYAIEDALTKSIKRLRESVTAIEQHLNYSLVELTPPRTAVDKLCVSSIELKRAVLQELHRVQGQAEMPVISQRIQNIADDLNRIAEQQSGSGRQFTVMDFEYEQANRAVDQAKDWYVNELGSSGTPLSNELDATLDELDKIEKRLQDSFRSSIPKLASTTRERVFARLGRPSEKLVSGDQSDGQLASNTQSSRVTPPSKSKPSSSIKDLASSQWKRPGDNKLAANSSAQPADSGPSEKEASSDDSRASLLSASQGADSTQSSYAVNPADERGGYDPALQPRATYTGASAIQIKVIDAGSVDCQARAQEIAQRLGASRIDVRSSSDGSSATISFLYAGALDNVVPLVRFGTIEICDSQSRTLFVVAN